MTGHGRSRPCRSLQPLGALCALSLATWLAACGSAPSPTPLSVIQLSQTSLSFAGVADGPDPDAQAVSIENVGGGALSAPTVSISYGVYGSGWLTVTTSATSEPYMLTIRPSLTGLAAGVYTATVLVISSGARNSPSTLGVTLAVQASTTSLIDVTPTSLWFSATFGGSNPAPQTVVVSNAGDGTLSAPIISIVYDSGDGWLTATSSGSSAPYAVTVQPITSGLAAATYGATLSVNCPGASNTPQVFSVTLTVSTAPLPPTIWLSPASLTFTAVAGGESPPSQTITVSNAGGGTLSAPSTSITYGSGSRWLTATLTGSTAPYAVTVKANTAGLAPGTYVATVSVYSQGATGSPQHDGVTLIVAAITEYRMPTKGSPVGIAAGPDRNLWFADSTGSMIDRITTSGGMTGFLVPTSGSLPEFITAGPDGNLWFSEYQGNRIGRLTIKEGVVTEFPIPTGASGPLGIAAGPDDNLWFTESRGNRIGCITITGKITEFLLPASGAGPTGITAGPDGNLWFTEVTGNKIGRITTAGKITEFPLPTRPAGPTGITAGPDGNLWFAESAGNKIGRITTSGKISEFRIPTVSSQPEVITVGPDGNLWFTEANGNKIGRITTSGTIIEFPVPTSSSLPQGIAAGSDGSLWFTETLGIKIGRLAL